MATLVIKNLFDNLHAKLKEQAQRHRRSLNKETISLIEQALSTQRTPPKISPPVRLLDGSRPTIEDIEAAIAWGRE